MSVRPIPKPKLEVIVLDDLRLDSRLQMRGKRLEEEAIEDYCLVIRNFKGKNRSRGIFDGEPIKVVHDQTEEPWVDWLSNGYHRQAALRREGVKEYEVEIYEGDYHLAVRLAGSANKQNGLQRDLGAKKRSVEAYLKDEVLSKLTQEQIAFEVGCAQPFVCQIKAEMSGNREIIQSVKHENSKERINNTYKDDHKSDEVVENRIDYPRLANPEPLTDREGEHVPEALQAVFRDEKPIEMVVRSIYQLQTDIVALANHPSGAYIDTDWVKEFCIEAADEVMNFAPRKRCPKCKGQKCSECYNLGWLPKLPRKPMR